MEKLHQSTSVVNELTRILKQDYPYLEYSQHMSKRLSDDFLEQVRNDALYVRVIEKMEHHNRNQSVIEDICHKLSKATNIRLMSEVCPPGRFYKNSLETSQQNINTEWTAFRLYRDMINQDPNIHHGATVFDGTRVPVHTLIHHLKAGESLDDFLEGFPSVSRKLAIEFLEYALTTAIEAYTRERTSKEYARST